MELQLSNNQNEAVNSLIDKEKAVIIAPTGAGKTTTLLHTIRLRRQKFIVACPPKVVPVWKKEAKKWGLKLNICECTGTPSTRKQKLEKEDYDIIVVSLNNLSWLLDNVSKDFTGILIDELSKATGKFTQRLKTVKTKHITTRFGMTATPVSENFEKLFRMFRIIDSDIFGTRETSYLNRYFYPTDFMQYNWELRPDAAEQIMAKITPLLVNMDYAKTELLPELTEEEVILPLSDRAREVYGRIRKDMILESDSVTAANAAVLSGKLRQIATGFVMDMDGYPIDIDDNRAIYLANFAPEGKTIVIYEYDYQRKQLERALTATGQYYVSVYGGSDKNAISRFTTGNSRFLLAQQNTLSHGVDGLQDVCSNLVFYQPLWSADVTEQAIGRIWRQGQKHPVTVQYLVAENTVDELVMTRLDDKSKYMKLFLEHLKG